MRSLKTARPLLASVAYFVLFAMIMFSYVFHAFRISTLTHFIDTVSLVSSRLKVLSAGRVILSRAISNSVASHVVHL